MKVAESIAEMIGATPLLALNRYAEFYRLDARILVKMEKSNPAGSSKDRVALSVLRAALKEGKLQPGGIVIEASEGNLGVSIAALAAVMGFKAVVVMPEGVPAEFAAMVAAFGAQIIFTPKQKGGHGAVEKARELRRSNPGAFMPSAYKNPAAIAAHCDGTAEEIWRDTEGKADVFVAGVGSGAAITGVAKKLKKKNKSIQIIAVEPQESAVLSGKPAGEHTLFGLGAKEVPEHVNMKWIDEIIPVREADARATACALASSEGILVGPSSGAAVWAATLIARMPGYAGKNIVALLPDGGERYLSTGLYGHQEPYFLLD